MRVLFRADASHQLGGGHVMRCVTLADSLRESGADICFLCRELSGHYCDWLQSQGYKVLRMPAVSESAGHDDDCAFTPDKRASDARVRLEIEQSIALIEPLQKFDWLVVDHYELGKDWESALRTHVHEILAIDDLANRVHDCDVLLDQNFCVEMNTRYDTLVSTSCVKLLGPKFALLRPNFSEHRPIKLLGTLKVLRVVVFLSSSDPSDFTSRVLRALDAVAESDVAVDIVIGANAKHSRELSSYCEETESPLARANHQDGGAIS
jgi:UDP-2,4-diacetamido-2,4,6-trideoxy-beta-L-altropyranose hydrolase